MQEKDFETLAGSVPFPASDIAADYSPVEKERIQGPITRSLVVPAHKGPLGGKVPLVSADGRTPLGVGATKGGNIFPPTVINAFPFFFTLPLVDYSAVAFIFSLSSPDGATPGISPQMDVLDSQGNWANFFGVTATAFPYRYVYSGYIASSPFPIGLPLRFGLTAPSGGLTHLTCYLDLYQS